MRLLMVLGKTTKLYAQEGRRLTYKDCKVEMLLIKRLDNQITVIAWEILHKDMSDTELRALHMYTQQTKIPPYTRQPYTPDDKGWGNKFESKADGIV